MTTTNHVSNTSTTTNDLAPANPQLAELAACANAAHERVFKAAGEGLLAAFEAGQALLQARKLCPGRFLTWLPHHFKYSTRTAQQYMKFAKECLSIGGFDAQRAAHLPAQEMRRIWSQILGRRSGKNSRRLPGPSGDAATNSADLSAGRAAGKPEANAAALAPTIERTAPPINEALPHRPSMEGQPARLSYESGTPPVDGMSRLVALFAELIADGRRVAAGDDSHDSDYAECLVEGIEPHYTDLLEYMDYRRQWRGTPRR